MAHIRSLVLLPLAALMTVCCLAACERKMEPAGDPRVDGIYQRPLPQPDISILSDQRNNRAAVRPSAAGTATTSVPASAPAPEAATPAATAPGTTAPATAPTAPGA